MTRRGKAPSNRVFLLTLAMLLSACDGNDAPAAKATVPMPVVVYGARAETMMEPVFDRYTETTGVPVKYLAVSGPSPIRQLQAEGASTSADLLLAMDAGELWYAAEEGILRPAYSDVLEANIPAPLRDPENLWFAMTVRARTIVYDRRVVDPAELVDYAGLADERWKGRLCLSTAAGFQNRSLVAALIVQMGARSAETVVRGWVRNLATRAFPDDSSLIEATVAGLCQVGIVDTEYFGRLQREDSGLPLALFWPGADSGGVHVNVYGAGVARHAHNAEGATALLEWMSGPEAQTMLGAAALGYPANPVATLDPRLAAWGKFSTSPVNVARYGAYREDAVKLMDRAGYR